MDAHALRRRGAALSAARDALRAGGYVEVPTPVLVPSPALEEALFALPCEAGWLRTSPEFALKKVLAAGLPRIYELGPCLRGREQGPWHAREFLMLEWYRAGAHLDDLIVELEQLVAAVAVAIEAPPPGPFTVRTVRDVFLAATGLDPFDADAATLSPRDADDWDAAFFRRWVEDVEPTLRGAVVVRDWPARHAALATTARAPYGVVARRFEAYLGGVELANAFQELLDADALRARFAASAAARDAVGEVPHPVDEALIAAVARMPSTAGIAVGFDRLVAVLSGWDGIGPGQVRV